MDTNRDDLAMPPALDVKGETAYIIIRDFLKENNLVHTGGCRTFYSPKEWKERREEYGLTSKLIVVYDGSDVGIACSMDAAYETGSYELLESLNAKLKEHGLFMEECTCWYAAVYLC